VVATPLNVDEDTVPASFGRGDGEAGEGDGVAEPREGVGADVSEGEAGAGDGGPAKFGRRRGLAGEEDGAAVPGKKATTLAAAPARRHRRLEAVEWWRHH